MKSLLFCCLFGTFLATGMCLECPSCIELGQKCSWWTRTCDRKEDTCVTYQTEVIRAPVSITFTTKTCGTSDTCHLNYVETSLHNNLTLRAKRACCTGEECNTLPPVVLEPQVNQEPNGLQCPGCIGLISAECTEHLVYCRASETQCLSVTAKNPGGFLIQEMSFKGCASESLCSLLKKKPWTLERELELDIKCTPAPHKPSHSLPSDA